MMRGNTCSRKKEDDLQLLNLESKAGFFSLCNYKMVIDKQVLNVNEVYEIKNKIGIRVCISV